MTVDPEKRALQGNRKECHQARDAYFQCMTESKGDEKACRWALKAFKEKCPESWVNHFMRKFKFDQYKQAFDEQNAAKLDEAYKAAAEAKSQS